MAAKDLDSLFLLIKIESKSGEAPMKTIQSNWMFALLFLLLIMIIGQIVIHWETNTRLVWFNGICAFILSFMMVYIQKNYRNKKSK